MLSTEDLALLEAIRETGSLSRAAAHLGKAPSTVSYAARQLEERFDALQSGVPLSITQEVLKGVWEASREGRADLVIGATNEPPAIASLCWMQLGEMEWVFAVSPKHPLAKAKSPITRAMVAQHRAIVVADSSRVTEGSTYGVTGGQPVLAVPTMRAKILAQCNALGVGWLPRHRVGSLLKNGALVEKPMADPPEPNILYAG
ncbi:HTH-type transcriptional activator AllS [compost metagenome]